MTTRTGKDTRFPYRPDYAVPPGLTLQETIDALGMPQNELATRTGLNKKTINQIIQGIAPITPPTALLLQRVTGVPARMWNNLEAHYREQLARQDEQARLAEEANWLKEIPVKELVRRGILARAETKSALVGEVLNFFRVATVEAWKAYWSNHRCCFRKSLAQQGKMGVVATWLRLGELEAEKLDCQPFDRAAFRAALDKVRALTTQPPEVFLPAAQELCAQAGVAFVVVKEIPGAPVSGATRWLTPEKALLQLSLRYKSDDQFWFSFFHEAGHILYGPKSECFLDNGESEEEAETQAHRFAQNVLIPAERARELADLKSADEVKAFAAAVGIAPGIVVGRMQREGIVGWGQWKGLKRRLEWGEEV